MQLVGRAAPPAEATRREPSVGAGCRGLGGRASGGAVVGRAAVADAVTSVHGGDVQAAHRRMASVLGGAGGLARAGRHRYVRLSRAT